AVLGDAFLQAVQLVAGASSVLCIGAELSSAAVARLTAGMLTKFAVRAVAEDHPSEQRALVEVADPGTVLFVVSYRGANERLVDLTTTARSRGLAAISLTNNAGSPLARASDVSLLTGGPILFDDPSARRIGARSAQFALARALAEAVGAHRAAQAVPTAQRAAPQTPRTAAPAVPPRTQHP
ncbi:MAG TPA: SIS domain-containing protein, partial [Chloroflexota bacterium]|nr:SIS domain-containing protein [Chloroflexota bacterium]